MIRPNDAKRNSIGNLSTKYLTWPVFKQEGIQPTLLEKAAKANLRGKLCLAFLAA